MAVEGVVDTVVEVVVIGAGFAGLAAAQVLGRAQREVLVLGSGPTRNAEAEHAHNVLTRDGTPPGELLALGMAEVEGLPKVTVRDAHVDAIEPGEGEGLRVRLADGSVVDAEVVVLATGARDRLPEVNGLAALWGRRAHSCPFCDGEAYAGRRVLILADEGPAAHSRSILSGWTDRLTVAAPSTVTWIREEGADVVAHLADGQSVSGDGVFVAVTPMPRTAAVAGMTLARRGPFVAVDARGQTTHPRLWAVGDCAFGEHAAMPGGQVIAAMADGARAAAFIVFDRLGIHLPELPTVEAPRTDPVMPDAGAGAGVGPAGAAHAARHGFTVDPDASAADFWEAHYAQSEQIWSGNPNGRLVEAVEALAPGRALDLGCGEGADSVWLAAQGWQVTAADVSATAMSRGAVAATAAGVADRIDWQRHDFGATFPEGTFDLVNASYLLSPLELPRGDILQAAARAVAPGGALVVLGHCGVPPWLETPPDLHFPTPEEELGLLDLAEGEWVVEAMGTYDRPVTAPDGAVGARTDTVLHVRRLRR